jgi:hypothetical protein
VSFSTAEYLVAPLLSVLVVALLAVLLRWAFGSRGGRSSVPAPGEPGSHGLLVPLLTLRDPARALALVAQLRSEGIRASVSGPPGRQLLLVWPTEVARAAQRLRELTGDDR